MSGVSEQPSKAGESAVARKKDAMTGKERLDFMVSNIGDSSVLNKPMLHNLHTYGER